jgi:TonB family protein
MKRCNACSEFFADHFTYCPTDATLLTIWQTSRQHELHLTIIDNAGLLERLAKESGFLFHELRQAWPQLKRDPIGAGKHIMIHAGLRFQRVLLTPNAIAAVSTAVLVLFSAVLLLVLLDKRSQRAFIAQRNLTLEPVRMIEFPSDETPPEQGKGDGANGQGRVGLRAGKGEGSGPEPKKSTGGGGSGNHDQDPAQVGAVPPPSEIPAPIPKLPPPQKTTLPYAGIDIDPALWQAMPMNVYGDPRSKSSVSSNGPGEGGGMGTAKGMGIGEGDGPGFGSGKDGNIGGGTKGRGCCGDGGAPQGNNPADDPDHIYPPLQVTERARVLAKPEPQYTEEARKGGISGAVVLRVVFSRTGEVTNIRAVKTLPFGLTEKAIAAARQIRFRPAMRDGRAVNVSMQLEYNFNLY